MLLKKARFEIKTFILCESQSGYEWSMIIYIGKDTTFDKAYKDLLQSTQTVITLMNPFSTRVTARQ